MKKKLTASLLALCLAFSLAACSSGESGGQTAQTQETSQAQEVSQPQEPSAAESSETPQENGGPEEEEQLAESAPEYESAFADPVPTLSTTLEEQVLYEDNGIAIRATGIALDESGEYEYITLALENNTAEDVDFAAGIAEEFCVNGYMISDAMGGIWETVPAGETADAALTFFLSQLERYGIEEIGEVAFEIYTDVGDPGILTVRTSAADSYERLCDTSGLTVYEDERYKVVYQGTYQNPVYAGLTFYLENNTDDIRSFDTSLTINGEEGAAIEGIDLYPHTAALLDVDVTDNSLFATLDDVETISVKYFCIYLRGGDDRLFTPEFALDLSE